MTEEQRSSRETPEEIEQQLSGLVNGATMILRNALALYEEASTLRVAGAHSRALFLHQISLEECAKIEILGGWAVGLLTGMEGDSRKKSIAFTSHKAKNYTNAYFLERSDTEETARQEGQRAEAIKAFKAQQADFHLKSNTAKNAALYVDFRDGLFSAPDDRISEQMAVSTAERNEKFLALAEAKTALLKRWAADPSAVQGMLDWSGVRLKELMASDDPEDVLMTFLKEAFERARSEGSEENGS